MQTQNSASDIFSAPARALPAEGSGIALRAVTAEDLAALRRAADAEGFGRLTCRPVHTCADADLPARYARVLQNSSAFVCGLYLPGIEHAAGKLPLRTTTRATAASKSVITCTLFTADMG